jgi:hypothetical protein
MEIGDESNDFESQGSSATVLISLKEHIRRVTPALLDVDSVDSGKIDESLDSSEVDDVLTKFIHNAEVSFILIVLVRGEFESRGD